MIWAGTRDFLELADGKLLVKIFDRFKKKATEDETERAASQPAEADSGRAEESANSPVTSSMAAEPAGGDGIFARLRQGLQKTSRVLNTDIRDLFKQEGQLVDDAFLSQLFATLVRTDMGAGPAKEIREQVQSEFRGRVVQMEEVLARVKERLLTLTDQQEHPIELVGDGPTVIMVVGVNGSGKTTSIAKLTRLFTGQGKKVVLGAGDTFRAAAVEQLSIWANRLGAEIVTGKSGADPASVAHRAVAVAVESQADVCIVDTAGRLQTQANLMDQLTKIRRVVTKQVESAPHEVLLVLDATAGQNAISQAKGFSEAVQCTGLVLAKLDGTAKGGVVIPIRQQFDIPVKYIGVGEAADDLALFNPHQFVDALFADPA